MPEMEETQAADYTETASVTERLELDSGMNNFWMNIPGGCYRELWETEIDLTDPDHLDEEKRLAKLRLFNVIDIVLATDLKEVDAEKACRLIMEGKQIQVNLEEDRHIDNNLRASLLRIKNRKFIMAKQRIVNYLD
jgi:hypothetical protein